MRRRKKDDVTRERKRQMQMTLVAIGRKKKRGNMYKKRNENIWNEVSDI